jgi:hypothetical protein
LEAATVCTIEGIKGKTPRCTPATGKPARIATNRAALQGLFDSWIIPEFGMLLIVRSASLGTKTGVGIVDPQFVILLLTHSVDI